MPGIGGEFSCLSRLCFFVVPRVSFCPICFSCQTVGLQPQGIPVKNASGADEARLLREAGAAYLRRSRPTDDPQGATGMDSRADSCGPVRSAGRHMASWPEIFSDAIRPDRFARFPLFCRSSGSSPAQTGRMLRRSGKPAGTAARPVLARIHRSRLFSTDLSRRFCVSPFLL